MASPSSFLWPQKTNNLKGADCGNYKMSFKCEVNETEVPGSSYLLSRQCASCYNKGLDSLPSSSTAHFSTQTLLGASSTIKFFLSEAVLGQHFYEVELKEGEPQPGDLFLFKLHSPKAQWCGAHVGVYCGHGEIIHFEGRNPSSGLKTLLASCEGVVCKQGHRALQRSRQLWRVLRRRSGVDPIVLQCRIREAMETDPPPYHPTRSNCVHFALRLLGIDLMSMGMEPTRD